MFLPGFIFQKITARLALLLLTCFLIQAANAQPQYDTTDVISILKNGERIEQMQPDSAAYVYKQGLEKSEDIYYIDGIIASTQHLYKLYMGKGHYDSLMNMFQESLIVCNRSKQLAPAIPIIYNGIGNLYKAQGKYEIAMSYYVKAISLIERHPYKNISAASAYNNLGSVLMTFERDDEALYYLTKAEQEAEKTNNYPVLAFAWTNKGVIYMYRKAWEQSKYYLQLAIMLTKKYNIVPAERFALVSLGEMYVSMKAPDKAINYSQQTLSLKGDIDPYYQYLAFRNLGIAYFQLHDNNKSKRYLLGALSISQKYDLVKGVADMHHVLADIYSQEGLYKEAYEHTQASAALEGDIQSENVRQNLNQLEVKYRTVEKDKDIFQKQLLISRQENYLKKKNIWIGGISAASLLLITLFVSLYRINVHKQQGQKRQIHILQQQKEILEGQKEISKQVLEIEQLKAMMEGEEKERARIARELHDGIGGMLASVNINLNTIAEEYPASAQTQKLHRVMSMLQATSSEVRKTAHNLLPDVLMRNNLKEALLSYCENINSGNRLKIDVIVHGELEQLSKATELTLYRIIQELVQNIVKHAQATYGAIQIFLHEEKLQITIEDNGIGFDVNEKNGGYGLQNLRFRVQALQGSISIMSAKGRSTTIHLAFDLEKLKNDAIA